MTNQKKRSIKLRAGSLERKVKLRNLYLDSSIEKEDTKSEIQDSTPDTTEIQKVRDNYV